MKLGLKTQLLLIIAVLIFITAFFLQFMSLRLTARALEDLKGEEMRGIVSKTAVGIDNSIESSRRVLHTIVASPEVKALIRQLEADDVTEKRAVLDYFAEAARTQPDVENILLLNHRGVVVADNADGSLAGSNFSSHSYFNALANRNINRFLSEVMLSPVSGQRVIVYAQKISTPRNPFAGVVALVLNFDRFMQSHAAALEAASTGEAVFIDPAGSIVSHREAEMVGQNILEAAAGSHKKELLEQMIEQSAEVSGYYSESGVRKILFAQPVANWFLILSIHESAYLSALSPLRKSGITLGLIFFLLGALAALYFSNRIAAPIVKISRLLELAGQGDLTQSVAVSSRDEVGVLAESVNAMIAGQRNILQNVFSAAQNVASYSQQLSASVEESNASMQHVATTIDTEVSKKADEIVAVSNSTLQSGDAMQAKAKEGEGAVSQAVGSMEEINRSTREVQEVITQLNNASEQIGSIVVTITDIAEQTNLLALNAAIEAARAGEQGRGFAVVAEEVRKLAEQSSRAAGEIGVLIVNIQKKTGNAVEKISSSAKVVEDGTSRASRAMVRLAEIREAAEAVKVSIADIVARAESQSVSAQEIASSAEEQTAVLQEIASTSNHLAGMASELNNLVYRFKL